MSMYGTYLGFSLPLRTSAALVASRPRVWPLASTTYHLRSISLPLGTKVLISLLPSYQKLRRKAPLPTASAHGHNFHPLPNNPVRVRTARFALAGLLTLWNEPAVPQKAPVPVRIRSSGSDRLGLG